MNQAQYGAIRRHVGRKIGYGNGDFDDYVQEAAIAQLRGASWDHGIATHQRITYRWLGYSRLGGRYWKFVSGNNTINGTEDIAVYDTIADTTVNVEGDACRETIREILDPLTRRQQTIALMLANDTPGHVIAEHLGIHESRISQIIHDIQRRITNGPPASHHHPVAPADRRAYVVKRRREGAGYKQIADELAVTEHAIKHHVRNARRDGTLP